MNARSLLAVVLLLALGVMFFSWGNGTGVTPPATPEQGRSEQPLGARGDQAGEGLAASVQRAALTDLPSPEVIGKPLRLLAVTASGVPVGGAKVRFWPAGATDFPARRRLLKAHDGDMEAALQAHGDEAITDAAGFVEVLAAPESDVTARLDDDYGQLDLYDYANASGTAARIVMTGDVTLEVDVVDSDGRPVAGHLIDIAGTLLSRMTGVNSVSEVFGPSDAHGKVVVPHLLWKVDVMGEVLEGQLRVSTRRQIDDEKRPLTIATQSVPHTALHGVVKVRLVDPVGGAIEVRALDADGNPVDVLVSLREEGGAVWRMYPPTRDAAVVFAGVPLSRRWRAVAHCAGQDHIVDVVGPRASGQRVAVEVPMPVRRWRLTGRLVRADGSPIVKKDVLIAPKTPHPFLGWRKGSRHSRETDELGRIAISYWLPASVHSLTGFTVEMIVCGMQAPDFRIERLLTVADSDMGDLVNPQIGEDRLLARFEFSCEGKPLKDARADVKQLARADGDQITVKAKSKRSGHVLELWGVEPGEGPLLVTCKHDDCLPKLIKVPTGDRVSVAMDRSASLVVRMDCGDLPVDDLTVSLTSLEDLNRSLRDYLDTEQQVCEWDSLRPGSYRLRIEIHGVVVHDETELVLKKGDNSWPANGQRLDLGSRVNGIYLFARSAKTQEYIEVNATLVPRTSVTLPDDPETVEVWFPQPETPSDLLVHSWGYVPVRVPLQGRNVSLQLQPATSLRLKQPANAFDEVRARLLVDPLTDRLLLAFDEQFMHDAEFEFDNWHDGTFEQDFLPGTKLELTPLRAGIPLKPVEVVIGTASPQVLQM